MDARLEEFFKKFPEVERRIAAIAEEDRLLFEAAMSSDEKVNHRAVCGINEDYQEMLLYICLNSSHAGTAREAFLKLSRRGMVYFDVAMNSEHQTVVEAALRRLKPAEIKEVVRLSPQLWRRDLAAVRLRIDNPEQAQVEVAST
jgi:hypothetical protein